MDRHLPILVIFLIFFGLSACGASSSDDPAKNSGEGSSSWDELVWDKDKWG